eukprot:4039900-Ditylum_brightwellii.AAC.1
MFCISTSHPAIGKQHPPAELMPGREHCISGGCHDISQDTGGDVNLAIELIVMFVPHEEVSSCSAAGLFLDRGMITDDFIWMCCTAIEKMLLYQWPLILLGLLAMHKITMYPQIQLGQKCQVVQSVKLWLHIVEFCMGV